MPLPVQEPEHPSDALTKPSLPEQGAGHQGDSSNNTHVSAEPPSEKVLPILNVASEFSKGDKGTTIIKLC